MKARSPARVAAEAREGPLPPDARPATMLEAVGYPLVNCREQAPVDAALVLKHDHLFMLVDPHGDVAPAGHCGLGLFHDDTRILSQYALRFQGGPAALLSSDASRMFHAQVDLAIAGTAFIEQHWDTKDVIHIRRDLLLDERLTERLTITNYLLHPVDFWVELSAACDFADIFEVRGWKREGRGQFFLPAVSERELVFRYRGRDGRVLRTAVCFERPPAELGERCARWRLRLIPRQPVELQWQVLPEPVIESAGVGFREGLEDRYPPIARTYAEWQAACTRFTSDVEELNLALAQATTDLRALYVVAEGEPVISAGIPWYSAPFGRDSIIASLQTLPVEPRIARDTLVYLARHQGGTVDPFTEEQPGKIMHELRRGEMARAGEVPHVPYYGTVDATPLWLVLLHEYWRWTGDDALVRALLPNAVRALAWIDAYGDIDGDGFVEYARTSEKGLVNQGWKDSWDGVPFPDGSLPQPPIALVEVQGYVYDAKARLADLFATFGDAAAAERLRREAGALRQRIVDSFWLEGMGTFALALDGEKRPIPTSTSNAGHLLWSRVPTPDQAERMAGVLLGPGLFSGWGIRTLSGEHPVFNPMSYHNGSIWPHDNALVALGFSLADHKDDAMPVFHAMYEAALGMRYRRLPELFCGMRRDRAPRPVHYPVSCSPQAWAAGAFFMLLQAALGLLPDAPAGVLHVREPVLPDFLREILVSGLRVGGSRVTLQFTRRGRRTLANLLEADGAPLRVSIDLR